MSRLQISLGTLIRELGIANDITETEENERLLWTRHAEFVFSSIGFAVGLGNLWRFPYLCYESGGGAFLVPYLLMLVLCGLPLYFMESSLGQYAGSGPNILFKHIAPGFRGIGYAMIVVALLVTIYYNVIIGWTLFYTFASFTSKLGWETCGNNWNTPACFHKSYGDECIEKNLTFWNNTCLDPGVYCKQIPNFEAGNNTHCINVTDPNKRTYVSLYKARKHVSSTEEYFLNNVLGVTSGIEHFGSLRWKLVLCLLLAWVMVVASLIKGVKSSGKVVFFTVLFPYFVLLLLLIRGATLEGSSSGVHFYIVPNWNKLSDIKVWGNAAKQIFYTLGIGFGGLQTLASYNPFNNDCCRDAITVSICNCATSIFAGFAIFLILGFMAHSMQLPLEDVISQGQGLAFVAFPEAATHMPFPQVWSFLFFFMITTVGIDSQFILVETAITAAEDEWPILRKHKFLFVIFSCSALFLLGLPLCGEGGVYYLTLLDSYSAGWPLVIIATVENLFLAWKYGISRFSNDIKEMIGYYPGWYWRICWVVVSPLVNVGIIIFVAITYEATKYGDYEFPGWAVALGWLMALASVIMIPIFAAYEAWKFKQENKPCKSLLEPTENWKPQAREDANLPAQATNYQATEAEVTQLPESQGNKNPGNENKESQENPTFSPPKDV